MRWVREVWVREVWVRVGEGGVREVGEGGGEGVCSDLYGGHTANVKKSSMELMTRAPVPRYCRHKKTDIPQREVYSFTVKVKIRLQHSASSWQHSHSIVMAT